MRFANLIVALTALLTAGPAASEERGEFNVSIGTLRAGVLAYDARERDGAYTMRGAVRPSALIGALFDGRVDSVAEGRVNGNAYRPRVAREITRDGDDTVERSYRYSGGVPEVTRVPDKAPSAHAAPAAAQGGTVDLTTAAFAILRDRPDALACALDIAIFDGTRRHRIRLNVPQRDGDTLICTGEYRREAGFSPEDMAGRQVWPLRMEYLRQADGTHRVERLSFPTSFGTFRIARR